MHVRNPVRPPLIAALALACAFTAGPLGYKFAVAQSGAPQVDPPARVGRIARLLGSVSFHGAEQIEWQDATTNYPVTSGDAVWTQPNSAATIDIGSSHLALDQSTEFDFDIVDDHNLQATEPQGVLFLRVRVLPAGDLYRITTPRGAVVITAPGAYELVAGDANHPTLITVVEGSARIDSTGASLTLGAHQTGRIEGDSRFAVSVGPAANDRFLTACLDEERQTLHPSGANRVVAPTVVTQMSGGDALASTGSWASSSTYGQIWYPPVEASWVPYRDGHWGYVAPWGWTWIDDAPWGFAPFHYGRWVQDGPRWGWIPVERGAPVQQQQAPVYAPALVSFISVGVAVGVALSPGGDAGRNPSERDGRGSVGWVPLGPRETYVPPYRTSERYLRAVNVSNVTSVTNISNVTNVTTVNNLVNRRAATVVPVDAMTASEPVRARVEPLNARALAAARPQRATVVQPTTATIGVTPVVAKEMHLAAPTMPVPTHRAAPGPVVPSPAATPIIVQSRPASMPSAAVTPAGGPRPNANATAPNAARPATVALPVLRAATPAAPAHPQAGGTAVVAPIAVGQTSPAGQPAVPAPSGMKPPAPPLAPTAATPSAAEPKAALPPAAPIPPVVMPVAPVPVHNGVVPAPSATPQPPLPQAAKPAISAPIAAPVPNTAKPEPPAAHPAPPPHAARPVAPQPMPAPKVAAPPPPAIVAAPPVVIPPAAKPPAPEKLDEPPKQR